MAGLFMGAVGYAADIIMMAPSRDAAQNMLRTCEQIAAKHEIKFSTDSDPSNSKSKVVHVTGLQGGGLQKPVSLHQSSSIVYLSD